MSDHDDDRRQTLDELVSKALAYRTGPELKALLDFSSRFPYLAPFNAMMLHVQNPGIRYAAESECLGETVQAQDSTCRTSLRDPSNDGGRWRSCSTSVTPNRSTRISIWFPSR